MERKGFFNKTPYQVFIDIKNGNLGIRNYFASKSNSVLFWNAIAYVIYIPMIFMFPDIAGLINLFASVALMAFLFDDSDLKDHMWPPLTVVFWFAVAFVTLIMGALGIGYLFWIPISKFNNWLDKKRN